MGFKILYKHTLHWVITHISLKLSYVTICAQATRQMSKSENNAQLMQAVNVIEKIYFSFPKKKKLFGTMPIILPQNMHTMNA